MGWFGSKDANSFGVPYEGEITTDTFLEHLNQIEGTKNFRLLEGLKAVVEGPIANLRQIFTEGKVTKYIDGIVMDGIATQPLIDFVIQTNINAIVVSGKSMSVQKPNDIVVLTQTSLDSPEVREMENNRNNRLEIIAREKEEHLDYEGALEIWVKLGNNKEAKRIRQKMMDEKKVEQTVVHGDYVDDRDTIVKDSVINRSNVGAGGKSKAEEIKEIKELLDSGAIDDDEFKQMKKEILGK